MAAKSFILVLSLLFAADALAGNFLVRAPNQEQAQEIADRAEQIKYELATNWFGQSLSVVPKPIPLVYIPQRNVQYAGVTSFSYNGDRISAIEMEVRGEYRHVMADVLPHEVMHVVTARIAGRRLPRWLDEGLASNVESLASITRLDANIRQFLIDGRGIPMDDMMRMTEYPEDTGAFYAQSSSVVRFMLWQGETDTMKHLMQSADLSPSSVAKLYGYDKVKEFQNAWVKWVSEGSPRMDRSLQFPSTCQDCEEPPRGGRPTQGGVVPSTPYVPGPSSPYAEPAVPRVKPSPAPQPSTNPIATSGGKDCDCDQDQPASPSAGCDCDSDTIADKVADKLANAPKLKGPKGDQGERGPQGEQGPEGPPGTVGREHIAEIIAAIKADPDMKGPKGDQGDAGKDAVVDLDALAVLVAEKMPRTFDFVLRDSNGIEIDRDPISLGGELELQLVPLNRSKE